MAGFLGSTYLFRDKSRVNKQLFSCEGKKRAPVLHRLLTAKGRWSPGELPRIYCCVLLWAAEHCGHSDLLNKTAVKPSNNIPMLQAEKFKRAWDYSCLKLTSEKHISSVIDQSCMASGNS